MKTKNTLSVLTLALVLAACGQSQPTSQTATDSTANEIAQSSRMNDNTPPAGTPSAAASFGALQPGLNVSSLPSQARLGETTVIRSNRLNAQALPSNAQTSKVALKVLVISSGAGDYGLDSATSMLQEAGVPYDVLDASTAPLSSSTLIDSSGVGRYQGVILTSNGLSIQDSAGNFVSALDSAEWADLFQYEASYKVRQLALYGYPGVSPEDYGLRAVAGAETSTTSMTLSSAGRAIFNDLTSTAIPVNYSYSYPSTLQSVPGVTTQPLATDPRGRILAVTSTSADGRERLLLTTAENPYLTHTQLLSYGLVQWLTKGVHLGENRRFLQVDIDDWFLSGTRLDANTLQPAQTEFRLSASDALSVRDQQTRIRWDYAVANNFKYAMVFNGGGADLNAWNTCLPISNWFGDPLTSVSRCMAYDFDWVNHTKDHLRMDVMDYNTAYAQISQNFTIGSKLGLNMNRKSLVTGEHSGLGYMDPTDDGTYNDGDLRQPKVDLGLGRSNMNMLNAASASNVRYLAANHSVASQWDASCSVCGVPHPLKSDIFLVPRWPNNIAYHVTTPTEETAFYNSVYGPQGTRPYWDHNLSYAEILDKETDLALNHLLDGGAFPHYMHQTNLRQYASGKSLATDWVRALLTKYSKYSTLPLNTLKWDDLGNYMLRRTLEEKAKAAGTLSAVWDRSSNRVTVSSTAGSVPVTLTGGTAGSSYGAYRIQTGDVSGSMTVSVSPK